MVSLSYLQGANSFKSSASAMSQYYEDCVHMRLRCARQIHCDSVLCASVFCVYRLKFSILT
jgi:hypothetical protein